MNIQLFFNNQEIPIQSFVFPGGEVHVRIGSHDAQRVCWQNKKIDKVLVIARIQNSDDIMFLINLKSAIDSFLDFDRNREIVLFLPYCPYSRQDRVCSSGESHSLKVFCNIINSLGFDTILTCDPHSDVTSSLLSRCKVISQLDIISKFTSFKNDILSGDYMFVSPDAGANKKTAVLAKYFDHSNFIRADKLRNLENGLIKETIIYCDDLKNKNIVCADDICDGGRTFIELAKVAKDKGCNKFVLYVTHGIFSKTVQLLIDKGIDYIYTTDSYKIMSNSENIEILSVMELL